MIPRGFFLLTSVHLPKIPIENDRPQLSLLACLAFSILRLQMLSVRR